MAQQTPNAQTAAGFPAELRGFGPTGIAASLAILLVLLFLGSPFAAVLVLGWAILSRMPWGDIGYVRPRSWLGGLFVGAAIGIVLKFVLKAVVMPLLGAPATNEAYHYLASDPGAAAAFGFFGLIIGAGWGEETVFRGWMFERLGKLLGHGPSAKILVIILTSALFASAHYAVQGVPGVEQAIVTGLVFGIIFTVTGSLWVGLCAHAAYDLAALAMIYFGIEANVAHLVFP